MAKFEEYDVFGNPIEADAILRDDFIEPPFSVLDTKAAPGVTAQTFGKRLA